VRFLERITASVLTDTRSETEYVDKGTVDDAEKNALQIIVWYACATIIFTRSGGNEL
jgi:hypothetical protein